MAVMGRPTTYRPEMVEQTKEYIEKFETNGDEFPHNEGLAGILGCTVKTLYNWAARDENFLHVLGELQDRQRRELLNKGINGQFNSNITKLVLGKHGYSDKVDNSHASPTGGPVEIQVGMDPKEASSIYQELMKAVDKP